MVNEHMKTCKLVLADAAAAVINNVDFLLLLFFVQLRR
jgi:hypothetical protein